MRRQTGDDFLHAGFIEGVDAAAAGIGQQAVGEHVGEAILALDEDLLQAGDVSELFAAGQFTAGVDVLVFVVTRSIAADGIKVLESKAERIDLPMAAEAVQRFAMLAEQFADGLGSVHVGIDRGHVIRRRRGRCAEDVFQQEPAACDGRGLDAVGGDGEHGAHAEQATTFGVAAR